MVAPGGCCGFVSLPSFLAKPSMGRMVDAFAVVQTVWWCGKGLLSRVDAWVLVAVMRGAYVVPWSPRKQEVFGCRLYSKPERPSTCTQYREHQSNNALKISADACSSDIRGGAARIDVLAWCLMRQIVVRCHWRVASGILQIPLGGYMVF